MDQTKVCRATVAMPVKSTHPFFVDYAECGPKRARSVFPATTRKGLEAVSRRAWVRGSHPSIRGGGPGARRDNQGNPDCEIAVTKSEGQKQKQKQIEIKIATVAVQIEIKIAAVAVQISVSRTSYRT